MAETVVSSPAPSKGHRWLRILGWIVGLFLILVIVGYFVATSSAFFKGVILPKASKALNATITVSDASISPFSQVILKDLKVQTTGADPLVTASEVRLRYSLMDIIKGNIHVDEVALVNPTIVLVQNPDKTSNLDPLFNAQKSKPAEANPAEAKTAQPSKPLQIDLKKIALQNATVRQIKLYAGGTRDVTEVSQINITLEDLKNGQTGKFSLEAQIKMENNPPSPAKSAALEAKLNGSFTLALSDDLKPSSIKGNTHLQVTRAEGALAQATALSGDLDCDLTPTQIQQLALRLQKAGTQLAQLRVSGPFDMQKLEGRLTVELLSVDKDLLNLAGTPIGLDFGTTTVNSTNTVDLAQGAKLITVSGRFNLDKFQVTRAGQTTPSLDLHASYDVVMDRSKNLLTLRTLTLSGVQEANTILHSELTSPMQIALGSASGEMGDAALNLAVNNFNIADWKAFVGPSVPSGMINAQAKLLAQNSGKNLNLDLSTRIDDLTVSAGSNQLSKATVTLQTSVKIADTKQFTIDSFKFDVARQNQSLVTASASGSFDKATTNASLQLDSQLFLARLLQAMPQPGMSVSSGDVQLKAQVGMKGQAASVTGNFALNDFTGKFGNNSLQHFGLTADLDIAQAQPLVQIRKLSGQITSGSAVGGSFNVTGSYNLTNKVAQLVAKLSGLNQNGIGAFLQPALGDKTLVSVAVNANSTVQYDPQSASSIKADLQVTNLVVNDPSHQIPATPLQVGLQMDTSLTNSNKIIEIRQLQLALTPTARGTNQIQLTGKVDMTQASAIQGSLKLAADSIDVTTYYDLFMGQKQQASATKTATPKPSKPAASAPAGANQEPPAMKLPLGNFTTDVAINRFYLHEMEITNMQTTIKIDGGHIVVNPFKLALNGAPITATVDADLGIPGYKYAVDFNAQAIPLTPLVNTFTPDYKDQVRGTFTGTGKVSGQGITGASLQKNLSGQFNLGSTNLNLDVTKINNPLLRTLVKVIVDIPSLIKNPASKAMSFLGSATGATTAGTSTNDITRSPVEIINASGNMGLGKINLQQALVQSPAFQAQVAGTITLAPELTNSALNLPVSVYLDRSIAQSMNLTSDTTATNAAYAQLPDFLTITGTMGNPKQNINKAALLKVAIQGASGAVSSDSDAGKILKSATSILGGGSSTNSTGSSTNSTAGSLLKGLLGGASGTNSSSSNAAPVKNLLKGWLK